MWRAAKHGIPAVAAWALAVGSAEAQRPPAGHVGLSLLAADPVGELGAFFDEGYGAQLEGRMRLDPEGLVFLRGDLGFVVYGYQRRRYCMSIPFGCRIELDLTTTNNIFFGGIGPEVAIPLGALEPYAHASFGFSYFATRSSLSGEDEYDGFGDTTNYSDAVFAWRTGGGLRVRLSNGRRPVSLDFGAEHHVNGVADFLVEGGIVDHPDGSITLLTNRSEANLVTFRLGVSVGIR